MVSSGLEPTVQGASGTGDQTGELDTEHLDGV